MAESELQKVEMVVDLMPVLIKMLRVPGDPPEHIHLPSGVRFTGWLASAKNVGISGELSWQSMRGPRVDISVRIEEHELLADVIDKLPDGSRTLDHLNAATAHALRTGQVNGLPALVRERLIEGLRKVQDANRPD